MTGIPLAWDVAVTLTASYQKVFSGDPTLGFFSQRDRYQTALDQGEVLAPATSTADMESIVTNSTVDGVLAALFAVLIIIVVLDASRVWVKAIRAREPLPDTESPFVPARILAPAGMFWTGEEREMLEAAGGTGNGAVRANDGRFEREPETAGAGGRTP